MALTRRKQQRIANQWRKALKREERAYYREIRALYKGWYANLLRKLSALTDMRLDSRMDSPIGDLFAQELEDWNTIVQTFTIRIMKRASNIKSLSKIFWDKAQGLEVDMSVNPFVSEPWLNTPLNDFAEHNVLLIKNIGAQSATDIQRIVQDGQMLGKSAKTIASEISAVGKKFSGYRANLIARDQVSKLNGQLTMIRSQRSGIDKYEWSTSEDERVRPKHKALNGDIRTWDQDPIPGQEINCRCVAIAIIED